MLYSYTIVQFSKAGPAATMKSRQDSRSVSLIDNNFSLVG